MPKIYSSYKNLLGFLETTNVDGDELDLQVYFPTVVQVNRNWLQMALLKLSNSARI
jgi:hypothetical protein